MSVWVIGEQPRSPKVATLRCQWCGIRAENYRGSSGGLRRWRPMRGQVGLSSLALWDWAQRWGKRSARSLKLDWCRRVRTSRRYMKGSMPWRRQVCVRL